MSLTGEELTVVVVEDDFRVADINAQFVGRVPGFRVVGKATTGREARRLLEQSRPDLLLLDVYLPDMRGTDLLRHIRQQGWNTDVIMLTAALESETVQAALRNGAVDYILKPILFERLQATLERYRHLHRQLRSTRELTSQVQVDQFFNRGALPGPRAPILPKGIDPLTLEKVTGMLQEASGLTAEMVAQSVGVSRSTARRYLEYLIDQGEARADLAYGTVGRPERRYARIRSSS